MDPDFANDSFMVWASDHLVYGPVDLYTLIEWVKDARVLPKTWLLAKNQNRWCSAESIEPLRAFFANQSAPANVHSPARLGKAVETEELRQFHVFSGLTNEQLDQFIQFGELLLRRNDPGDSLFFLLSGELRVRLMIGLQDKTLGTMTSGECFGEIAMFMRTSRTADVVVETDARMLRITSEAFLLLVNQLPHIAAPILLGMTRVLASRISQRSQQYQRDVAAEFLWH
jgi:CRP-like cAMP-binding protein